MDFIYFIHDPTTSTVKIGMSKNPEERIQILQSSTPQTLHPIRYVQVKEGCGYDVERFLQNQFSHLHVKDGWFQAEPEIMNFAKDGEIPKMEEVTATLAPPVKEFGKRFSIHEVSKKTGISPRNIRYYISEKLIPGPVTQGPRATYEDSHIKALQDIKYLKDQGLSLEEVRNYFPSKPILPPHKWKKQNIIPNFSLEDFSPSERNDFLEALEHVAKVFRTRLGFELPKEEKEDA